VYRRNVHVVGEVSSYRHLVSGRSVALTHYMAPRVRQFAITVIARAQQLQSVSYMGKLIPSHCQCHCAGWLAGWPAGRLAGCISHRRQDVHGTDGLHRGSTELI